LQQIPAPGSQSAVLDPGWTVPDGMPTFAPNTGRRATRPGRCPPARSVSVEATKLLKQQHDEVKGLFKQFESAEEDSEKQECFDEIADAFAAHRSEPLPDRVRLDGHR